MFIADSHSQWVSTCCLAPLDVSQIQLWKLLVCLFDALSHITAAFPSDREMARKIAKFNSGKNPNPFFILLSQEKGVKVPYAKDMLFRLCITVSKDYI